MGVSNDFFSVLLFPRVLICHCGHSQTDCGISDARNLLLFFSFHRLRRSNLMNFIDGEHQVRCSILLHINVLIVIVTFLYCSFR